jgi:glyoxylase-like metal-dependent hydrolase (beta-lactamase superfamily II)
VILTPVEEMLARAGLDPAVVRDVVLTHMHFDHPGGIGLFPTARFHSHNLHIVLLRHKALACIGQRRMSYVVDPFESNSSS